jgi:hypothetical protein
MVDQLKEQGEVGAVLEEILIKAGFRYSESSSQHEKKGKDPVTLNLLNK